MREQWSACTRMASALLSIGKMEHGGVPGSPEVLGWEAIEPHGEEHGHWS